MRTSLSTVNDTMYDGTPLLDVQGLVVEFSTREGVITVVNDVSFSLEAGAVLAILGESGSGKSVTAQAIMGILDTPPGRIAGGKVIYAGQDLLTCSPRERRRTRGREIAMIFQDALCALNPVFTVGWQISEALRQRENLSRDQARDKTIEIMDMVGIPAAHHRVKDYPHEFSGGMRQRIMIAMVVALRPKILIADEPTTALDVTVQAHIMDLLEDLRQDLNMAMILITHDLGIVAQFAHRVAVMYAGRIMEHGLVRDIYATPGHPYTQGLLNSYPHLHSQDNKLIHIRGNSPDQAHMPSGCFFHPRCPYGGNPICSIHIPENHYLANGTRMSTCHFAQEILHGHTTHLIRTS